MDARAEEWTQGCNMASPKKEQIKSNLSNCQWDKKLQELDNGKEEAKYICIQVTGHPFILFPIASPRKTISFPATDQFQVRNYKTVGFFPKW